MHKNQAKLKDIIMCGFFFRQDSLNLNYISENFLTMAVTFPIYINFSLKFGMRPYWFFSINFVLLKTIEKKKNIKTY